MESQKRQVAYKVSIKEIMEGQYFKEEGWKPNYIQTKTGKKVSRINIVANIVMLSDSENFESMVIDDGTSQISVRSFENQKIFQNLNIGDTVLIIGKPREFGSEIYLIPEIIKKIENKGWVEVRKKELVLTKNVEIEGIGQNTKKPKNIGTEEENIQEKQEAEEESKEDIPNLSSKIIKKIKELDKGEGVDFEQILANSKTGNEEWIIKELLKNGEIFEVKPNKYKVLE